MGQQQGKKSTDDESGEESDTSDQQSDTIIQALILEEDIVGHDDTDGDPPQCKKKSKKKEKKRAEIEAAIKPPETVKSFLSADGSDVKLKGSFKKLEQEQLSNDVKEQNFFLDDIPEEGGATSLPPPPEESNISTKKRTKKPPPKKRSQGRKSRMKIVPLAAPEDGDTCISLSNFNAVMVPNELFDIVLPPPPEFSTPNFVPQDDKDIEAEFKVDDNIYKYLTEKVLEPNESNDVEEADDEYITPTQLYNCMNDGQKSPYMFDPTFLLLIDTRTKSAFDKSHIATAHHLLDIQSRMDEFKPIDQYTMIVLYDEDGRQYSLKNSDISVAMDTLLNEDADAYVLDGGFSAFPKKFPYWCTKKVPQNLTERAKLILNLPSIVLEDKLFIGQAEHANKQSTIDDIGISHIVCISHEIQTRMKKVTYHHIKLADEPSSRLHAHFADTIAFIEEGITTGGKVLVHCNLGQSRSATIVIAYLMFSKHWILEKAFKFLLDCRPVVHPNEGFMQQLSNFENALFGKRLTDITTFGYSNQTNLLKQCESQNVSSKPELGMKQHDPVQVEVISEIDQLESSLDTGSITVIPQVTSELTTTEDSLTKSLIEQSPKSSPKSKPAPESSFGTKNETRLSKETVTSYSNSSGDKLNTHRIFKIEPIAKNTNEKKPVNGVTHCLVKSFDDDEKEDFEEEILLSETALTIRQRSINGIVNEAHDDHDLSGSRDTLDKTIIAI